MYLMGRRETVLGAGLTYGDFNHTNSDIQSMQVQGSRAGRAHHAATATAGLMRSTVASRTAPLQSTAARLVTAPASAGDRTDVRAKLPVEQTKCQNVERTTTTRKREQER